MHQTEQADEEVIADHSYWTEWCAPLGLLLAGFTGQDSASFKDRSGEYITVSKFRGERASPNFQFLDRLRIEIVRQMDEIQRVPCGPSAANDFRIEPPKKAKKGHENRDLMLKTAAVYLLSDWAGCSAGDILKILDRTGSIATRELGEVETNINKRGRHNLIIDVRRE